MAEGALPGPRRLVLLRHGRTAWNLEGRAQGHADVELDAVGHAQAAAVAPMVAGFHPVSLWGSDLARAHQTAAYVAKETGLDVHCDRRLREYDVGERTGLTVDELAARHPTVDLAWRRDGNEAVPGAETDGDVRERMVAACQDLVATVPPRRTAVVVTHGAALRVAVVALLGWPSVLASALGPWRTARWRCWGSGRTGPAGGWTPGGCDPISRPSGWTVSIPRVA